MGPSGTRTCNHQVISPLLGPLYYAVPGLVSSANPITIVTEHISSERARRSFHTPLLATLTGRTKFARGGKVVKEESSSAHTNIERRPPAVKEKKGRRDIWPKPRQASRADPNPTWSQGRKKRRRAHFPKSLNPEVAWAAQAPFGAT